MKNSSPDPRYFRKPFNIQWLFGLIVLGIEIAYILGNSVAVSLRRQSDFHLGDQKAETVRSTIINKILSFQYRLGKLIGKKRAGRICVMVERTFTSIFGREVYWDGK